MFIFNRSMGQAQETAEARLQHETATSPKDDGQKEKAKRALGPNSETARPNRIARQGGRLDTWSDLLH